MIKNKPVLLIIFLIVLILNSCSRITVYDKRYYILEYDPVAPSPKLKNISHNHSIFVTDASVPPLMDKNKIILRNSQNMISFSSINVWAEKPSESISDLIFERVSEYSFFKRVFRVVENDEYNFLIKPVVKNIEFILYEGKYAAHLDMDLMLVSQNSDHIFVKYHIDRQKNLFANDFEMFIQSLSEIIIEETDNFLLLTNEYFNAPGTFITEENEYSDYTDSVLVTAEIKSDDILGLGRLFLPSITSSDQEPAFDIYDSNWFHLGSSKMGEDFLLKPGTYNILYGSGDDNQRITKTIDILPRKKIIIEPDWSALTINLLDESRTSQIARYEVYDLNTSESYGTGRGVQEELGELLPTWILKPGEYKIILNGLPFNTFTDFITVDLSPGDVKNMVIIIDSETGLLRGAGELFADETEFSNKGKLTSAIHANATLNNDNSTDKNNPETQITLNTQLDTKFEYDNFPYQYTMQNLIELGTTKESDTDFRISSDDFSLRNTFIYYFSKVLGTYIRGDADFHFFDEKIYTEDPVDYKYINTEGEITYFLNKKSMKISNSFFPLSLKEGLGFNLRLLNSPDASLYLRSGFGMRQEINNNAYNFSSKITENNTDYELYTEKETFYQEGLELSVVSNFHLPLNVTYSSTADFLFPFDKDKAANMDWENIFNIKIIRQLSIDYKLLLNYNEDINNYLVIDQTLYLRLSYFIY